MLKKTAFFLMSGLAFETVVYPMFRGAQFGWAGKDVKEWSNWRRSEPSAFKR